MERVIRNQKRETLEDSSQFDEWLRKTADLASRLVGSKDRETIMPVIQFREALRAAMTEEMERDENVCLMGEEVAEYNGAYKVSEGMLEKFGPRRIFDTPISEAGFSGIGIGAATCGLRPIVEFMSWSFTLVCLDQIVNNAANVRYMSGGQYKVPIVFRGGNGIVHQLGATHSHRVESIYSRIPGLIVVAPSTPYDAKGLLKASIRCDDPVIFLESEKMLNDTGDVPDEEFSFRSARRKSSAKARMSRSSAMADRCSAWCVRPSNPSSTTKALMSN